MRTNTWKVFLTVVVGSVVMAEKVSHAQSPEDFCRTVHSLEAAAPSGFKDFRGSMRSSDSEFAHYEANITLPNAASCGVMVRGKKSASFSCRWNVPGEDASGGRQEGAALFEAIKRCYPGVETSHEELEEKYGKKDEWSLETGEGVTFEVSVYNLRQLKRTITMRVSIRFR